MGLFSKFKEFQDNRKQRKISKAASLIKNRKAIKEDRAAALDFICSLDDPTIRVPALLQRFEYSLEHGINDTREKEMAMEGITKAEGEAIPLVKDHLRKTTRIAWPIKILGKISDDSTIVEALKGALNFEDISFDQAAVDKNYDILCYLRDYDLGDYTDSLLHFLDSPDERVRFAAAEVIVEQAKPETAERLEPFISDESSENRRIRKLVIQGFVKNDWTVKDLSKFEGELVTEGIFITKAGKLENRRG